MGDWVNNSSCGLPNMFWLLAIAAVIIVLIYVVMKNNRHRDGLQALGSFEPQPGEMTDDPRLQDLPHVYLM